MILYSRLRPPRRRDDMRGDGRGGRPRFARSAGAGEADEPEGAVRPRHRRRLLPRQLHAVRRVPPQTGQGIGPHDGRGDREDRRRPPRADRDHHVAREPQEARAIQGDQPQAGARREPDRRSGASAREGRQVGRLDRRRPARDGSARRAAAHRDDLSPQHQDRSGNDADPERRHHPVHAREPGRHGAGLELVHARDRSAEAVDERRPAALAEVRRA